MDIKETEKMLEKSANDVKMRDFSEVWQDIKGDIEVPKKQKNKIWSKKYFPAILAACFALIFAIGLPIFLLNPPETPEIIYYSDKLVSVDVDETTFFTGLSNANITHVDFFNYEGSTFVLYKTDDNLVKGGSVDLYDNMSTPTEIIKLKFYDASVNLDSGETEKVYEATYTKTNLTVSYNLKESFPEYNVYIYDIMASYNKVNYIIDYTCCLSDPTVFFDSFFVPKV